MYIHAGPMDGLHDGCAGEPSATRFRSSFVQNLILHHGDSRKSASSADILKFQLRSGICMNTSDEQKSPHKRALLTAKLICILFYVVIFLVFFCPFAKKVRQNTVGQQCSLHFFYFSSIFLPAFVVGRGLTRFVWRQKMPSFLQDLQQFGPQLSVEKNSLLGL